jgi:prolyl 4-hydroxylase
MGATRTVVTAIRSARILGEADVPPMLQPLWTEIRARAEALGAAHAAELRAGEIQLVRYPEGGFFLTHYDAGGEKREWRKISVIVYLNDDFGGGATRFPAFGVEVRPRVGHALTFLPYYAHDGEVVTGGEKYILLFWLGRD